MKILLFGDEGQVGWELKRSLALIGIVYGVNRNSQQYCGDFLNPEGIKKTIKNVNPDIIVNASAYTDVNKAEIEKKEAYFLNATSVQLLALEAQKIGAWLIHYSTEYVFSGKGDNYWTENDKPDPLNIYGKTKLAGEEAIIKFCEKYLIFRSSWIYSTRRVNFLKSIKKLAMTEKSLEVIVDQIGAPTSADLLADCTAHAIKKALADPKVTGLYHVCAAGETSCYDYARFILEHLEQSGVEDLSLSMEFLTPITSLSFKSQAIRPLNSRLNTDKFKKTFDLILPTWEDGVKRVLTEFS